MYPGSLRILRAVLIASLVGVLGMGVVLRGWLAGLWAPPLGFSELRSAHSHLAFYGLVFPGAWWAWSRRGAQPPGPRLLGLYAIAVLASTIAFAIHGYSPVSIAGSTVVLGVWILWAFPRFRHLGARSWEGVAGPVVLASAIAIPAVAVLSSRDDPAAGAVVRAFLTWLLLGVAAPAALARAHAPAPAAWIVATATLGAGLALGPLPTLPTRALLAAEGVILALAGLASTSSTPIRIGWTVVGAGLVALGAGLLPSSYPVTLAGLHFAALGPVLVTLLRPRDSLLSGWSYLALVGTFSGAIAAPAFVGGVAWPRISALVGFAVVCVWIVEAVWYARATRGLRGVSSPSMCFQENAPCET
ncbi:MAG: hypothetical protein KC656_22080 [Myxococcales bacterium]|nr:hypothetical protein [Myxococcales bacterium]MCB9663578.1 hypothetical protein [Alphaproteobacteria bacterium]